MKVLDLFSGIGGFSLGLERAGMETVAFCEIDKYCQKVLAKHWPGVPIYDDVREVTGERLRADGIGRIDVITGGFPCQDLSVAGKQAGITGKRSGLWGELARIIGDIRPRYAIVENVTALISGDSGRWFGRVLGDLAEIGYDAEWHCIPASELGAHHHRDRIWIICHPCSDINRELRSREGNLDGTILDKEERDKETDKSAGSGANVADPGSSRLQGCEQLRQDAGETGRRWTRPLMSTAKCSTTSRGNGNIWATEPDVGRVANGVPDRSHRLKALGNSVVPQIPELIGRAILQAEKEMKSD